MLILMVTAANKDDNDYDNKDTDTDNKQDNDVNNQFIHFFFTRDYVLRRRTTLYGI